MTSLLDGLKSLSDLSSFSRKPVPNTPDGLTDSEAAAPVLNKVQDHGKLFNIIESIEEQIKRGIPLDLDHSTISAILDALKHSQSTGIDDRKLLLEKVLTVLERLPPDSDIQNRLTDAVITLLYNDLPHPPATALGPGYEYRMPDGSCNNINLPDLGKARSPYTRSVQSKNPVPYSSLPDPGLIFDTLLRRDGFKPHPSGISSMMFAFANLIIHSLFKTDDTNVWQNNTSSYLDLSPLYGCSLEEQLTVRNVDGRGLLHEDTFADQRLLMMPPATPALLLMFSRNHNYIATKLLQINERNTYVSAEKLAKGGVDDATMRAQDDDIFNKAKLVNCGHFMNIIISDYIGAILGVTKDGSDWALNPLNTVRSLDRELTPRGQGNVVSVEFNLLYRWHAVLSQPDEIWAEKLFDRIFPDKANSWQTVTPEQFKARVQALRLGPSIQQPTMGSGTGKGSTVPPPPAPSTKAGGPAGPTSWTFGGLTRDPKTGRFNDDDLARILQDATSTVAQAFRGRGTPPVMRVVEMIAIEQARAWGVGSLNEFRQFIGLRAYASFEEWNPDKEIAQAARALYGHIDNLELYVGMQAEEAKVPGPGAGLCPGYTISRAILADAVALTRGDRFLTTDFTPYHLSSWGFQDCARDKKNGAFGSCMSKILLRNLPTNYTYNNVYGLFSFYTPETMTSVLTKLKIQEKYTFDRPIPQLPILTVNSWEGVNKVLSDSKTFRTTYSKAVKSLTNGYGFFIAEDEPEKHMRDFQVIHDAMYPKDPIAREQSIRQYQEFYLETTQRLLLEKSASVVGCNTRTVDVVRDVCNLIPVHWVSEKVAGIPLKTAKHPHGVHTEQEVYLYLMAVFTYIFLNVQPETGWFLQESAEQVAPVFESYIESHIAALKPKKGLNKLKDSLLNWFTGENDTYNAFLQRAASSNLSPKILSYNIFGIIVASSANFAMAAALIVNFYLDDAQEAERAEIIKLAHTNTKEADTLLMGYILEALRFEPQAPGLFREVAADTEITEGNGLPAFTAKRGQTVFVSIQNANMDPTVFPNPKKIDPTRPVDKYKIFGAGMHACLGQFFVLSVMPQVIRAIFSLKKVRRAPGLSGFFNRFEQDLFDTSRAYMYINANGEVTPWPASMHIQYDL